MVTASTSPALAPSIATGPVSACTTPTPSRGFAPALELAGVEQNLGIEIVISNTGAEVKPSTGYGDRGMLAGRNTLHGKDLEQAGVGRAHAVGVFDRDNLASGDRTGEQHVARRRSSDDLVIAVAVLQPAIAGGSDVGGRPKRIDHGREHGRCIEDNLCQL